jgi:hypothetical protein
MCGLPQLDRVPLTINEPGMLAVLGAIGLVEDVAVFRSEHCDHNVKVLNAAVDHERVFAWSKLIVFFRIVIPDQSPEASAFGQSESDFHTVRAIE